MIVEKLISINKIGAVEELIRNMEPNTYILTLLMKAY